MADRTCEKCGKAFRYPAGLRDHRRRKTTCAPIVDQEEIPEKDQLKPFSCKYCARRFASQPSLVRHTKQYCKIANSEEGMEKLFEHTLRHQNTDAGLAAKVDRLATLVEQLALQTRAPATLEIDAKGAKQVNTGSVTNIGQAIQVTQNIIQINPWDGERRISVGIAEMVAAFAENARLKEYVRLGDRELTDPDIAPPYVTELLVDLTKRAHADPSARNVYLNPRRADQALAHMQTGKWEVLPLSEATRLMFDGVAQGITAVSRSLVSSEERRQLPLEAQNALSMAGLMYDDEPEEYAKRAKGPMSAHLVNTAPAQAPAQAPAGAPA